MKDASPRNILLIIADCARSEKTVLDLPCRTAYTQRSASLPFLDYLRERGTTWTGLCAVSSTTTPNVASMFTGLLPHQHGVREHSHHGLREDVPTVAEILRRHGYHTYAEFTGPLIAAAGLGRGFDHYRYRDRSEYLHAGFQTYLTELLPTLREPWFLCLHLWEAHQPYQNPTPFDSVAYGLTPYDRALSLLDHQLHRMRASWDLERTCIVYCGDHGERLAEDYALNASLKGSDLPLLKTYLEFSTHQSAGFDFEAWFDTLRAKFGEIAARIYAHNVLGHGFHLTEDLIRIPLVIAAASHCAAGQTRQELRSQTALGSTLLDLADIPPAEHALPGGSSLLASVVPRTVYIEANGSGGKQYAARCYLRGARTERWKYWRLEAGEQEHRVLWDLRADPRETVNVLAGHPQTADELDAFVTASLATGVAPAPNPAQANSRQASQIEQKMRELGYL